MNSKITYNLTSAELGKLLDEVELVTITIRCKQCGGEYSRSKSQVRRALKRKSKGLFCSVECKNNNARLEKISCSNCDKVFQPDDSQQMFCSRSCAAIRNNTVYPKRAAKGGTNMCHCGGRKGILSEQCNKCSIESKRMTAIMEHLQSTVGEYKKKKYTYHHFSVSVRRKSRQVAEFLYNMEKRCSICGYDTYVELCHIKPISSFHDGDKMSDVDARSNLVYLCPNHHKELDLGFIKI